MKIQLWSYNYDPEPTGIAPVSRVFAQGLTERGHDLDVVAAHPHYPEPRWGSPLLPYREDRGLPVLRLPLWVGRGTAAQRYRQELTFTLAQTAAIPTLGRADVIVAVSPSFPALAPAMLNARVRSIPWVLWLQDILPDGAISTGIVGDGLVVRVARWLEQAAYRSAAHIVVISETFKRNLMAKGVPERKISVIYNPTTRTPSGPPIKRDDRELRILSMGNIGRSQGLAQVVETLEASEELEEVPFRLLITGTGVAADEVRAAIRTDRIEMLGLVDDDELEHELLRADIALVSQRHGKVEFNLPSKLMTFMAYGLPVLALVSPYGEVARVIEAGRAGWVVDSDKPDALAHVIAILRGSTSLRSFAQQAEALARAQFGSSAFCERFEGILRRGGNTGEWVAP